ncbi:uncharacterized protein Z519_08087 [Cladophialophora bantiana CBS 173.52]|uniref:Mannosyltransferase n=1 Tax=Cladophialophora bantiana (strain ATCC 10958 / CBS 173.52 / CDC B-1940 / NIH 8579) TaxID=1442370 RepID=A0A0D2FXH5_CLAB1|nr:uncharacterized protein Z519_08087 [Cladophialophora bantiana CBS 173.52]KIW91192.1 hypothetical protein Z519_08087 [Cladophialophora bantiana CBS 173.52]
MDPSSLMTPTGQRAQSLSLPSTVTAVNSASSAASSSAYPPVAAFTRPTTRQSSSPISASLPSSHRQPYKSPQPSFTRYSVYAHLRRSNRAIWRWLLVLLAVLISAQLYLSIRSHHNDLLSHLPKGWRSESHRLGTNKNKYRPVKWLKENSYPNDLQAKSPKAALISLVRNEELDGILQSMRQLEFHWNRRYRYPWIFFNEKPFSEEFKAATSNATSAQTEYHLVPHAHWATPSHINQTLYHNSLDYLSLTSVGKGHLLSYHAMIRWQSGLFYLHPALAAYEYYWRVEPDVHFFCDIPYDPFRFMQATGMVYGFNMVILDDARSFASLWSTTRDFITAYPDLVHPEASLDWLLDPQTGLTYNNCQFFSNFEIGSLAFFREDEGNRKYFDWLEERGGFYYSRWGDAPVHTLSVSMFLPPDRVWWFRDIGYQHDIARHCPPPGPSEGLPPTATTIVTRHHTSTTSTSSSIVTSTSSSSSSEGEEYRHDRFWLPAAEARQCTCEPTSLDENFYKLVPMESPQRKPADTCIRLWLGGDFLKKKDGWSQETERMLGGDGYSGYVMDGM